MSNRGEVHLLVLTGPIDNQVSEGHCGAILKYTSVAILTESVVLILTVLWVSLGLQIFEPPPLLFFIGHTALWHCTEEEQGIDNESAACLISKVYGM